MHRPQPNVQVGVDPGIVYRVNSTDPRDPSVVHQFSKKRIENISGEQLRRVKEAYRLKSALAIVPEYKAATEAVAGVSTRTSSSAKLLAALQTRGRNFR